MKRSEIKKIVEDAYIDLSKVKKGQVTKQPGVTTKVTDIDPETGRLTWDVKYEVDPEELYKKLTDIVDFMKSSEPGSEIDKIKDVLKQLKNKAHRLINNENKN
jgi:hypothetical protein